MNTKTVGVGKDYSTISSCIAAILTETGGVNFIEEYTVKIYSGTYNEYPDFGALKPTATYRLFIENGEVTKPIIDAQYVRYYCTHIPSHTTIKGIKCYNPISVGIVNNYTDYNEIYECELNNCNTGILVWGDSYSLIHDNLFLYTYGNCISSESLYSKIYNNFFGYANGGSCISIDGNYWGGVGHHIDIYNNMMWNQNVQYNGVNISYGAHDINIYNNNIIDMANVGIYIDGSAGTPPINVVIKNNIISSATGLCIVIDALSLTGFLSDYNDLYPTGTCICGSYSGVNKNTLADWQGTGQDTNSISADPLFVTNYTDMHLQVTSPCNGTGVSLSAVFTEDYDGYTRDTVWDIGIFAGMKMPVITGENLDDYSKDTSEDLVAECNVAGVPQDVLVKVKDRAYQMDRVSTNLYRATIRCQGIRGIGVCSAEEVIYIAANEVGGDKVVDANTLTIIYGIV